MSSEQQEYPPFICGNGLTLPVEVRLSHKARHKKVAFHRKGTLEVVIPARHRGAVREASSPQVQAFLEEHRAWIERTARRLRMQIEEYHLGLSAGLPTHLEFPVCDELWTVKYHHTSGQRVTAKFSQGELVLRLHGPADDEELHRELYIEALRRFVHLHAKTQLPSFAWQVVGGLEAAGQLPVRPASISVNNRKSAWGVCTRDGRIRIDYRVVLLPRDLVRQIVLHELAHLRHHGHQTAFYRELFSYENSTREAEHAVKQATRLLPAWIR